MHESSLAGSVLAVLRRHREPYRLVRVTVGDVSAPAPALAGRLRTHLAAADPPVTAAVEVVLRERERLCAACATGWSSAEPGPACPACGGPALPAPHDHTVEVELLG
jgi:Zn finger protein HypA/HybF involved in hydrogenase expression